MEPSGICSVRGVQLFSVVEGGFVVGIITYIFRLHPPRDIFGIQHLSCDIIDTSRDTSGLSEL